MSNPLLTERKPVNALPKTYAPPGSSPYRVKDGDDWASVAAKAKRSVKGLMHFNFMTLDPAEVNWYLRVNVGCKVPDKNGWNWKFTSSANPGIIYIPHKYWDFEQGSQISGKPPLKIEWASGLNNPGGGHAVKYAVDIAKMVAMAAEVGAHSFVLGTVGVVLMPLATLLKLEGAHADAIASAMKYQLKKGYSLGVVLAANGAKLSYVKNSFLKYHPVPHAVYEHIGKDLQSAFNTALLAGYHTAQQLSGPQIVNLLDLLHERMEQFAARVSGVPMVRSKDDWKNFSEQQKKDWYFYAALAFEQLFLQ